MYILQEMQTTDNQTALVQPRTFSDRLEAESAALMAAAAAAVSKVQVHTVLLVDEHGNSVYQKVYEHFTEAEA
jgi:hypothetical protein